MLLINSQYYTRRKASCMGNNFHLTGKSIDIELPRRNQFFFSLRNKLDYIRVILQELINVNTVRRDD
jgi:hypothetical protein